ncbi:hypothetical protein GEV33_013683 [Tenebrio molitor]|uniref:Integrase catalytic domain-containing protein n=1 Tax=Tenebrio molitor TaxID=7067 RepID=A0A8J6LDK5_TENMO|nr:hypothetical protein GEV33_013683 [Tenebrio molitor]
MKESACNLDHQPIYKNNSWKYVNGTIPKPKEPPEAVTTWESNDAKARSDLILTICPSELKQIKNCPTSKDIWNKLHSVYQSQGPARKAVFLKTLILLKMKNGEDTRDHIGNFFDFVDKLEEMDLCIINDLLAILLLYSIPDEYEPFRIAIETQKKTFQMPCSLMKILVVGADGRVVEGRATLSRHHREVSRVQIPGRMGLPWMLCVVVFVLCRPEKGEEKGWAWVAGESTPEPRRTTKEKMRNQADRKRYLIGLLDSGASLHMCSEKAKFQEIKTPKVQTLNLANSWSTKIVGSGTVRLSVEENLTVRLDETLYVPDLRSNLLSVAKMTEHGFEVIFRRNEAIITNPDTGENVIVARRDKDMYYIDELSEESRGSQISRSLQEWHERFGHLNEKDLKNIICKQKVDGIDIKADEALPVCETCVKGKQTRKPFTRYFVTFIDDKSRCCEVYFMKKKSEVIEKFKEYKSLVEKKTEQKIKTVRSDNGTEYTSHYLKDFLKQESIRHELTVEYTPQQNGVAERKNRSLEETARCLRIQSGFPASFWAEAILTANHIRNRCPSRSLGEARKVIRSRDVTFTERNQAENDFTDFMDEEIFKKNPENVPETQKEDKQTEICDLEEDGETLVEEENGEEIPVIMKRGLGRPKKVNEHEAELEEEENHENEELHDVAGLIDPEAAAWKKAMNAEYEALKRNKTWIIVDRPQGKKTVESRWVLRTKLKKDGSVDRRKARLVAKGFTQKPGIDFNETFAPVARLGSVRLFMTIAVELGLQVNQLDFTSAYLNGEIEEVFMEVPSEFYDILNEKESRKFRGNKVCLIRKALYGLKQSGRQWYKKLDEKLKQQTPKPLNFDSCVYITQEDGNIVIVVIYVDDLMVASGNPRKLQRLKSELSKFFETKDLGVTTPINPKEKLSKEMCPKTEEEKKAVEKLRYQSLVGSLMYLLTACRFTEAEYVALSKSRKEAIHLRRFLSEILDQPSTTIIFNDNQGAGQLSKNHVFHNGTKHRYSSPLHTRSRGERRHQGGVPSHRSNASRCFDKGIVIAKAE